MPSIPSTSVITGSVTTPDYIHTTSCNFVDSNGRTLLLRGVNLSGSSKAPVGEPSWKHEGFWEDAEQGGRSFVGRPLNVDDDSADVHLARLRGWGFTALRFPVSWEALEHEGPGKYDYEFMDYTVRVLRKCKEYGFKVFMDPHQDVWSRFSGGSGAPFWTLAACGIDPAGITPTLSAVIHSEWPSTGKPDPASVPAMIWGTNYARLLAMTTFTFFFGGKTYAPKCIIDGQNIQDWLQSHYINAYVQLAERIMATGDLADSTVIGWDSMNEPHHGMIGIHDLNVLSEEGTSQLKKGPTPTPVQSFRLGMGETQSVDNWEFGSFGPKKNGTVTIDPKGVRLWAKAEQEDENGVHPRWGWRRDPGWRLDTCPWAQHGVWDPSTGNILKPEYFVCEDFIGTLWKDHFVNYAKRIRTAHPEAILFVAPPVFAQPPEIDEDVLKGRACLSHHYYDGLTLITRHWNWFNADALGVLRGKYKSPVLAVKVGEASIRKSLREQLGVLKSDASLLGKYPTLIGEIGTPYDMDGRAAYGNTDGGKHKGDYSAQQKALDASLNACDGVNALSYTTWTYCPDSTHKWGDGWNMEDLSLWSADDLRPRSDMDPASASATTLNTGSTLSATKTPADSALSVATYRKGASQTSAFDIPAPWRDMYDFLTDGARAVKAFARPYPIATVGTPATIDFDIAKAEFKLTVRVRAEDVSSASAALLKSPSPSALSGVSKNDNDEGFPTLPTEIYVPIVHYADPSLLGQLESEEAGGLGVPSAATSGPSKARRAASGSSATLLASDGMMSSDLALDVQVSAGKWELEGQTLRWWYPVPSGDEDGEVTYEITIKRAGGPIKTAGTAESSAMEVCSEWWTGNGCVVM